MTKCTLKLQELLNVKWIKLLARFQYPLNLLHNCLNLGFLFLKKKKALVVKYWVCNFKWSLKMKQFLALCRKAHISPELFYLPFIIFFVL